MKPQIQAFFDPTTSTITYVVYEAPGSACAIIDPVLDFDPASGRMVITYQTFIVRTPKHTVLVDTCTGEDKGYPAPMDFPKQPWLDGFAIERGKIRQFVAMPLGMGYTVEAQVTGKEDVGGIQIIVYA